MAPAFLVRALVLGSAITFAGHAPAPSSVRHLRSVLPLEGLVLDWAVADVSGDGLGDLLVARRLPEGQRMLHVFNMRADGVLPTAPDHIVEIKRDIVSWGVGEFRPDEQGVELLFTTRSGAYTLSPRKQSYRDNIDGFLKADLLLDLASDRALPRWETVADVDGDGIDEVALATSTGFIVARVDGEVLGRLNVALSRSIRPAAQRAFKIGTTTLNAQPLADLLMPDEDPGVLDPPPILFAKEELPVPFFADANGDGLLDIVFYYYGFVFVHYLETQEPKETRDDTGEGNVKPVLRYSARPSTRLQLTQEGDWDLDHLELVHVGGTDAVDLLLTRKDGGLLENDYQVMLYEDAFLSETLTQPEALVQIEASRIRSFLADFDGDEHADLAVDAWSLTLSALGMQGVDIEHRVSGFIADGAGRIPARASFTVYEREFSADDFTAFAQVPALSADLNGDGLTDLMEPDSHGALEMHAFTRRGFEEKPQWTIPVEALRSTVAIEDMNRDGVGDFLVLHSPTLRKPVSTIEVFTSQIR